MAMLLVEEPEYRRETLRYIWQALRGARRAWRPTRAKERFASRLQLFAAAAAGTALYARVSANMQSYARFQHAERLD